MWMRMRDGGGGGLSMRLFPPLSPLLFFSSKSFSFSKVMRSPRHARRGVASCVLDTVCGFTLCSFEGGVCMVRMYIGVGYFAWVFWRKRGKR